MGNTPGSIKTDKEVVGNDTEGTAVYDTMQYVKNEICTIGVGLIYGHACMLLAAGTRGKRNILANATAMLHQPSVNSNGPQMSIEIITRWREISIKRDNYVQILSTITG